MDKKKMMLARKEMLKKLSNEKRSKMHEPMEKSLMPKKMQKVTVMAPDKEGLEKGLSKAQQILKAKLGEMFEEGSEEEHEDCPECEGKGCEACEEEISEEGSSEEY